MAVEGVAQTCGLHEWISGGLTCGGERGAFAHFSTRVMELGWPEDALGRRFRA